MVFSSAFFSSGEHRDKPPSCHIVRVFSRTSWWKVLQLISKLSYLQATAQLVLVSHRFRSRSLPFDDGPAYLVKKANPIGREILGPDCELLYSRPLLSLDGFRDRVSPCRPSILPPRTPVRKALHFSRNGYLVDYKAISFGSGGQGFPTWLAEAPSDQWPAGYLPSCLPAPYSHHCGHCPSR